MRKCYLLFRTDLTHKTNDIRVFTSLRKAERSQNEWVKKMDFLGIETVSSIKTYVLE